MSLKDVDGLFSATTQSRLSVLGLAEYLGINPPFLGSTIVGGSSFEYHVAHAMGAIALGLCNVAVIAYGSTQRSVGRKQASVREINPYETPFKPFLPSSAYALAASRHMHQFGTTREQLAAVAVAAREWALLNPAAWEKKPLTIEGVLSSRMVSYPFTVRDCCLVTDGGGAIVVTSAERAKSLKKPPAYVLGCGQSITHANISSMPDLTVTGALAAGKAAYEMAKLGPADVDAVELYDAFTINTILFLEDLGFCKKGEGGAFVSGGRIAPKGSLAGQHQRRRAVLLPPGHVRPVPVDRGGAPAARRMRRAPGEGLRGRAGARQRRRAVVPGDRHSRARRRRCSGSTHQPRRGNRRPCWRTVRAFAPARSARSRARRSARRESRAPQARPAAAGACDRERRRCTSAGQAMRDNSGCKSVPTSIR